MNTYLLVVTLITVFSNVKTRGTGERLYSPTEVTVGSPQMNLTSNSEPLVEDKNQINRTEDLVLSLEINGTALNETVVAVAEDIATNTSHEVPNNTSGQPICEKALNLTPGSVELEDTNSSETVIVAEEKQMAPQILTNETSGQSTSETASQNISKSTPVVDNEWHGWRRVPETGGDQIGNQSSQSIGKESSDTVSVNVSDHTNGETLSDVSNKVFSTVAQLVLSGGSGHNDSVVRVRRDVSNDISDSLSVALKLILTVLLICLLIIAFLLTATFFRLRKIETQIQMN